MFHGTWNIEGLLSPAIEGPQRSEVGVAVSWLLELQEKSLDVLLLCLVRVELPEESPQFHLIEMDSARRHFIDLP